MRAATLLRALADWTSAGMRALAPWLRPRTQLCGIINALQAMVERYLEVDVVAVTPMGDPVRFRAHGWQARILQHEVDHLRVRRALCLCLAACGATAACTCKDMHN